MSTSASYHHGDLKAALLRAGAEILEKQGIDALKLRALARGAGVSHNAPYRHFPDRESLLAALAAEGFEMLGDALEKRPRREMGEAYVEFALAHPQRFRLMFGGLLPDSPDRDRRAYEALKPSFADLGDQAGYAAAAAWGMVHGLSHLLLDGHFEGRDKGQFVREVLSTVRFSAPRKT
jgi:AcrR family transcriptional regulator